MYIRNEVEAEFIKSIRAIAERLSIPEPDKAEIVKEVLLRSDAFTRSRRPVIAVTGVTHTGKSSLINALFDEKSLTEGLLRVGQTTDTTDLVMRVQFQSGLVIYDTPGGGGDETQENITRAFLGIKQLVEDPWGQNLQQLTEVVMGDASTYNFQTGGPRKLVKPEECEDIDLILFVVSVEAGLKRDDRQFFVDIASSKTPVIVVVNKVDLADKEKVSANLHQISRKLDRQAVPISAKSGKGLDKLAVAIHHGLPIECGRVLGETVNINLKKMVKDRQLEVDSVVAAMKTAQLVNPNSGYISDPAQYASNILGLYGIIVNQYYVSEKALKEKGIEFSDLWHNVEMAMETMPSTFSMAAPLTMFGLTWGAIVATIATGGLALAPISVGIASGLSLGALTGTLGSIIRRRNHFKKTLTDEFQRVQSVVPKGSRYETAAGVIAFGRALRDYCNRLDQHREDRDFAAIFVEEMGYVSDKIKPYAKQIESLSGNNEEWLIREIASTFLKQANSDK